MKRQLLGVLAIGLLLGADAKDDAKVELDKLQGTWVLDSVETKGKELPKDKIMANTLVIKGDKFIRTAGDKPLPDATFTIDPTKKPKWIDQMFTDKDGKTVVRPAVFFKPAQAGAGKIPDTLLEGINAFKDGVVENNDADRAVGDGVCEFHLKRRVMGLERGFEVGSFKDQGDDFSLYVHALIVVEILLRRRDTEADIDDMRFDRCVFAAGIPDRQKILAEDELLRFAVSRNGHRGVRLVGDDRTQRHFLKVTARVSSGSEPHGFKFSGHKFGGNFVAARGRTPAFELVVGEKTHVRADRFRADGFHGSIGRIGSRLRQGTRHGEHERQAGTSKMMTNEGHFGSLSLGIA